MTATETLSFELLAQFPTGEKHLPNYRVQVELENEGLVAFLLFSSPPRLEAHRLSDGARLWTFDSLAPAPHCLACAAIDWDNDGCIEVLLVQGTHLRLLDGRTGLLKKERDLSYDGTTSAVALANVPLLNDQPLAILLVQEMGVIAVNSELQELWQVPSDGNLVGHSVFLGDTDGDGQDECVFSIEGQGRLVHVDHDGSVIWSKSILDELRLEPEGLEDHVDQLQIFDINEDGCQEIVIATGGCCLDVHGNMLWHHNETMVHGQSVSCGRFTDAAEPLAVFVDAWTPTPQVVASNGRGELQWIYRDLYHRIFSVSRLNRGGGYLLVTEQDYQEGHPCYHVHLLDGMGRRLALFAFKDEGGVQMPHNPQAGTPPSSLLWRGIHSLLCGDVDGDGQDEIVIDDLNGVLRVLKIKETAGSV